MKKCVHKNIDTDTDTNTHTLPHTHTYIFRFFIFNYFIFPLRRIQNVETRTRRDTPRATKGPRSHTATNQSWDKSITHRSTPCVREPPRGESAIPSLFTAGGGGWEPVRPHAGARPAGDRPPSTHGVGTAHLRPEWLRRNPALRPRACSTTALPTPGQLLFSFLHFLMFSFCQFFIILFFGFCICFHFPIESCVYA